MLDLSGIYNGKRAYFKLENGEYVSIENDQAPVNPREFHDGFGTFLTWYNRYNSIDENEYQEPQDFAESVLGDDIAEKCNTMQDILSAMDEAGYAVQKIYIYDHSDVTYALGNENPFVCHWDSGLVGLAFVSPEKLTEEGTTKEKAIEYMKDELKEYSNYASGNVFYIIRYDSEGEEIEGCTFYGDEYIQEEYKSAIPFDFTPFDSFENYMKYNHMIQESL